MRAEYLVESVPEPDLMSRTVLTPGRGYDLIVIISDNTIKFTEYDSLGFFNHNLQDPWATCVLAVASSNWHGPWPTIAIESERYLGHFSLDSLPTNLFETLNQHRENLHDRGLSKEEWRTIRSYASPEEWKYITAVRNQHSRLIGWLKPMVGKTAATIIRHSDLSARGHRPHYPASLDAKNTRTFQVFSFLGKDFDPEKFEGCPVYFRIKNIGGEEQATDVEIILPEEYRNLGVSKIC